MILATHSFNSLSSKEVAQDITSDYPGLQQLINDMWETMYAINSVGLTGPEIGKSIRIMVIDTAPLFTDDERNKSFKKLMINPYILKTSGSGISIVEGCLPGLINFSKVCIKYVDENFVEHVGNYSGVTARIIQQKCGYFHGKIFMDILSTIRENATDVQQYDFTAY